MCALLLAGLLPACGGRPSEPIVLGAPDSIHVSRDSPASLSVAVPADLAIRVRADSTDVNVRIEARDAGDSIWRVADAPGLRAGTDLIYLDAGAERSIDIRLVSVDEKIAAGDVSLRVDALPAGSRRDALRDKAVRIEAEACAVTGDKRDTNDSSRAERFADARNKYDAAGSREEAAVATFHEAAALYYVDSDWQGAAETARTAARSASRLGLDALSAQAIALEGAALIEAAGNLPREQTANAAGTYERARQRLLDAAGRFEALGLRYQQAFALNYRGLAYHYEGLWDEADAEYVTAADLFRRVGSERAEAMTLQNRALLAHERGNFPDAIRRFDEALRLHSQAGEEVAYAHALHNSALAAQAIGEYDEALMRYHRAAVVLRAAGDVAGEARALHGMGMTFKVAGEPERARALLEQAVPLRKTARDRRGLLTTLNAMGDVERMRGRNETAIALHREALSFAISAKERSSALLGLGRDLAAAGEETAALETFDAVLALPLPDTYPKKGHAYLERASLLAARGGYAAAEADFERALAIHESNGAEVAVADGLQRRAAARLKAGVVVEALADADRALTLLERTGFEGVHAGLRADFLGARRSAYELRIAALLDLANAARDAGEEERAAGLERAAFATSERSRAHKLLAALADRSSDTDTESASHERVELYRQLAGRIERRDALLDQPDHDPQVVAQLARDIELLRTEIDTIGVRLAREVASGDDARPRTDPVDLLRIPTGTLLAEYFSGSERAWLFLASGEQLTIHEMPAPAVLEEWVQARLAGWRNPNESGAEWPPDDAIARALLSPMEAASTYRSLWIVPDGALHYLPLAFYTQGREDSPEFVLIPSLQVVEREHEHTQRSAPARLMAVIADPVFAPNDMRLASLATQAAPAEPAATTTLVRGGERLRTLERLPATAVEADLLRKLVAPDESLFLTGLDASRNQVLATPLGDFRILHFATHAFSDLSDPALSMLVLSQLDRSGHPQDGALRGYDIASLRLNADLVVLSSCETAVGKRVAGEGLLGLSHAFLQAGARTVVASLWQVPDAATAVLMREFYRELLVGGASAAEALRAAQTKMARESKWRHPYYWAGFQVVTVQG